jgi:hypothetical protein
MSDKGNGFIFLIQKTNTLIEIDSKDAKFNETFADCRAIQGKLTAANCIDPDLKEEKGASDDADEYTANASTKDGDSVQVGRQQRVTTPRNFLLPGTGTRSREIEIRNQQYSNLCLDNLMEANRDSILFLDCMEAQLDEDTKLMKESELLTACTSID